MDETLVSVLIFFSLAIAALASLSISNRFPAHYREDETHDTVRLASNIFVVATSLVLGLLLNSAKNTFEGVDKNVHAFATELIVLDRTLRQYGPEASDARRLLALYVQGAAGSTWGAVGSPSPEDRVAERLLDDVGNALPAPSDPMRADVWRDAHSGLQNVVKRHWMLIEESEGTIPAALLVMLIAWLILIFASFGYGAPQNAVVVTTFLLAALLISASIYLILDFDRPFSGAIQVSSAPLQRAGEELRR